MAVEITKIGDRVKVAIHCKGGKTQQQFGKETNINTIMAKAEKNGMIPPPTSPAQYGDFSNIGDFQTAQNCIVAATRAFNRLPAAIRSKFNNDPGKLIEFVNDPSKLKEAVELNLLPKNMLPIVKDEDRSDKPIEKPAEKPAEKPV